MKSQNRFRFHKRKEPKEIYYQEKDPYRNSKKEHELTLCPECGAVFKQGRWSWADSVSDECEKMLCPACQRIRDNYPAGIISLSGEFLKGHQREILNLVDNINQVEQQYHPLERVMDISKGEKEISITTTGTHIARQIGEAITSAYGGDLNYSYDAESYIRVNWSR